MTENELVTLKTARLHLIKGEDQEALEYYLKVKEENEENAEAEYMSYNTYFVNCIDQGESNENKALAYVAVTETFPKALEEIAESDGTEEEKLTVSLSFAKMHFYITDFAVKAPFTGASDRIQRAAISLYKAGNAIESAYASNKDAMLLACKCWKEGVKLQRKFYAYSYNGEKAEDYAAKIQKVEPEYVLPSKAGCISKG